MILRFVHLVMALAAVVAVLMGCRSSHIQPRQEYDDTITHAGTIADLALGRYDGFYAVSNLFRYGDHGLGTFDRLNGEMIMHSGVIYRADMHGALSIPPQTETTPYAVVTYFVTDRMFDIERVDQERFQRALDMRRTHDLPEAIEINGMFESIRYRSVPAQEEPYLVLEQALEKTSRIFTMTNVTGTMVGYYFPAELNALHPAGYHFHFVNAQRLKGGHVLDFTIGQARIHIDSSPNVQVFLPTNRPVIRTLQPFRPPANRPR